MMMQDGEEFHYLGYPDKGGSTDERKARYETEQVAIAKFKSDEFLGELHSLICSQILYISVGAQLPDNGNGDGYLRYYHPEDEVATINNALRYFWQQCRQRYPTLVFNEPSYYATRPPKREGYHYKECPINFKDREYLDRNKIGS